MNVSVFSKARYMNGVGFEILVRTPYQNYPQVTPPPPPSPPTPPHKPPRGERRLSKIILSPSENGSTLKGQKESKFPPFRVDPFQKGLGVQEVTVVSLVDSGGKSTRLSTSFNQSLDLCSRRQIDDFFLNFPRKQDLTLHAKLSPMERIWMKYQSLFSGWNA